MEVEVNHNQQKINPINQNSFREEDLHVDVHEINNHSESLRVGGTNTFLAFKNETTYTIASNGRWLKIIQYGREAFEDRLPYPHKNLSHPPVYSDLLNCFFYVSMNKLYRKDFNNKSSRVCLTLGTLGNLTYSSAHQKLILFTGWKNIAVVDVIEMRVELMIQYSRCNQILIDSIFLDEKEDRLLSVSKSGDIFLFVFNQKMRKLLALNQDKISFIQERLEEVTGFAVCKKSQHFLVVVGEAMLYSSRMIIFKISGKNLVQEQILDLGGLQNPIVCAVESTGYFGSHILWIGVEKNYLGYIQVYDYSLELETKSLRILEKKKIEHKEKQPIGISRFGDALYYTGWFGKVMKISLVLQC